MFSTLSSIFVHQITIGNEKNETNPEFEADNDNLNETLLSLLDDKNKTISTLKKQLENQKMQLTYYINRELKPEMIQELSESCTPQVSEANLPLNLALSKFCRQTGIKTTLSLLHERMRCLDEEMSHRLRNQEFVLGQIVSKLTEYVRRQTGPTNFELNVHFAHFIANPSVIDLFVKLLSGTTTLKQKLDCFRICCHRVMLIEEERNALADHVYSMPIEQRTNCNYLLGIEMEKAELENEIRRIAKSRAAIESRMAELGVVEKILHNLRCELNSSYLKDEGSCISKMVKQVNSEARLLLEMTEKQKRRQRRDDRSRTKTPTSDRLLFYIRAAFQIAGNHNEIQLTNWGFNNQEEIRLFQIIKKEADIIKKLLLQESHEEIKIAKKKQHLLQGKIGQILLENKYASAENKTLKQELKQIKCQRFVEYQRLKLECDAYKSQVEDLQVIREAYAQLVDQQPNIIHIERDFMRQIDEKDQIIVDLEKRFEILLAQLKKDEAKIRDQNEQIDILNRFLYLVQPYSTESWIELSPDDANMVSEMRIEKITTVNWCILVKKPSRDPYTGPDTNKEAVQDPPDPLSQRQRYESVCSANISTGSSISRSNTTKKVPIHPIVTQIMSEDNSTLKNKISSVFLSDPVPSTKSLADLKIRQDRTTAGVITATSSTLEGPSRSESQKSTFGFKFKCGDSVVDDKLN